MSLKYREWRRKLQAQRKAKGGQNSYQPGGFGLSLKPLEEAKKKKTKRPAKDTNIDKQPKIRFVMPTVEVIGK